MTTPTKHTYETAMETVKQYEKRQKQLKQLDKELGIKLKSFDSINFRIDKHKGSVIFAGSKHGKTLIGISECADGDVFELVIGKLIAVKKALREDISKVVDLVESESRFTLHLSSGCGLSTIDVSKLKFTKPTQLY